MDPREAPWAKLRVLMLCYTLTSLPSHGGLYNPTGPLPSPTREPQASHLELLWPLNQVLCFQAVPPALSPRLPVGSPSMGVRRLLGFLRMRPWRKS